VHTVLDRIKHELPEKLRFCTKVAMPAKSAQWEFSCCSFR